MKKHHAMTAIVSVALAGLLSTSPAMSADTETSPKHSTAGPAIERYYPTVREAASGLAGHTVYRPANLTEFEAKSVPVVIWQNGACRRSNYGFVFISTLVSAHGFVVIADGAFDAPAVTGSTVQPQRAIDAINWVISENSASNSQFLGKIDVNKIAMAGQSCGGNEALVAAGDARVKTLLAFNTGFFPTPTNGYGREQLANLHTPVLYVNGGPSDVAYQNSIDNYNLSNVPAYIAENPNAGHSGLLYGIRNGVGDTLMLTQAELIFVNWLDYTLNGNMTAWKYFFGNGCGLCSNADWKVAAKNWQF